MRQPCGRRISRRTCLTWLGGTAVLLGRPRPPATIAMQRSRASTTALLQDPRFKAHDTGRGHPEQPARMDAIARALAGADLPDAIVDLDPRPATPAELARCHAPDYVALVEREVESGRRQLSTGDTAIGGPSSLEVARLAAGAALEAVDAVATGRARNAFCAARPPGHHASSGRGMGFCLFNNVAAAARHAQVVHGLEKIAVVDWDVHHGNGTQDIFYDDPSVYFFSTHQSPWYPGTGAADETGRGPGRGTTRNFPFPAGTGRERIYGAMTDALAPALRTFGPDLILISAGFDSRHDDPLGQFVLTDEDFADMTRMLMELAAELCERRLVSILEGGYNLAGLGEAVASHVGALAAGP